MWQQVSIRAWFVTIKIISIIKGWLHVLNDGQLLKFLRLKRFDVSRVYSRLRQIREDSTIIFCIISTGLQRSVRSLPRSNPIVFKFCHVEAGDTSQQWSYAASRTVPLARNRCLRKTEDSI